MSATSTAPRSGNRNRVAPAHAHALLARAEHAIKGALWDCRMCGQCVLHETGLTCPMTCPKSLRNGPCGGVRADGTCEVKPEMRCVWLKAYERSERLPIFRGHIDHLRPPVDHQLEGTSSWINLATGRDRQTPAGWSTASSVEP
ncbi:MAG: methylenetetrahydrofolate reductase C-terminal domain-containing protein [Solirubrobacterales bacterium]|nr:methylenetetrahydrofolate reductase C-terminal domain-containing protein [Solirubrobacterales bacterium]